MLGTAQDALFVSPDFHELLGCGLWGIAKGAGFGKLGRSMKTLASSGTRGKRQLESRRANLHPFLSQISCKANFV